MRYAGSVRLATACLVFFSVGALAAELEEVVVTAQKRDQSLQEVPISVSALTSGDLNGLTLSDRADITQQIPNFQVNTWSPNLTTLNIRGVSQNNFVDVNEAPIAVYIDDVYMGSMNGISGQLFDMERVEVLRGPQGTLFGRNATGGLVHYVTRGASDTEMNARIGTGYGSFNDFHLEAAAGGHFGNPAYRWRFAWRDESADGYIEPAEASQITAKGVTPRGHLGGKDGSAFRLYTEFDIGEKVRLDWGLSTSTDDRVPTGGYTFLPFGDSSVSHIPSEWFPVARNIMENPELSDAGAEAFLRNAFFTAHPNGTKTGREGETVSDPKLVYDGIAPNDGFAPVDAQGLTTFEGDSPDPHTNFSDYEGFLNRTSNASNIKVHYEDNDNSFTSITAWNRVDKFYTEDGDGIPALIINFTTLMDYRQLSQEFRYGRSTGSGHHFVVGLYWLSVEYDGGAITVGAPAIGAVRPFLGEGVDPTDPSANQRFTQDTSNISLFGEADFRFNDYISLIVGARFTSDSKSIKYNRSLTNNGQPLTDPKSLFAIDRSFDEPNYTARLVLNFHLGSDNRHKLYLSANRGLKSGGFNVSANVDAMNIEYDSEILNSYELGFKSDLTRSLRFSTAAFVYDYKNYQAFAIFGGTPSISNADATAQGLELDLKYTPGNAVIGFGLAYISSDVDGIQGIGTQSPPGGLPEITFPVKTLNNKHLPNAPELSFNFLLSYDVQLGSSSSWLFQLDGVWYGDQYLEVTNGAGALQEAYFLLNFSTLWRMDLGSDGKHNINVKLYAKNITDSLYKLYNLDLGILGSTAYYAPPASFGLSFGWGYN